MQTAPAPTTHSGFARLRGLTVFELLAVVICAGVLSLIGILSYQQVRLNADIARARTDLEQVVRNAQVLARSEGLFQVHVEHLEKAAAEMMSTSGAAGGSSSGVFAATEQEMIFIPDYPTGGQGADDVLGVDYGPSLTYGYVSYKTSGTLLGLASRTESGSCVFTFADGVKTYETWTVEEDIGADCRGGNALAGRQDPGSYSYQDPLTYGSPAKIGGVTFVSATSTTASITWTASNATDLLGYKVYVDGSLASGATPLTGTSYTITGLSPNSLYVVRVSAIDTDALEGAQSNPLNAITVPATPTGLAAEAVSDTEITVTWDAQAYSTFRVYVNSALAYTGTATTYSFDAADPATTYAFQIDAYNTSGGSPISTAVNATTFPEGIADFAYSAATSSQSEIGLTWTPATGVITGYKIYRDSTTAVLATITDPAADSFVDSGRAAGANHTYRIRSYNATGDGTLSSGVVGFAVPAEPNAPSSASHTTSGLVLSWDAVSGTSSYQIYRNAALIATQAGTSYTDSGLTAGVNYSYQVKACNAAGCSGASAAHGGITKPASVTDFAVDADSSAVNLSWTESTSPVLSGYKVYYKTSAAGSYTLATTISGASSYQVASLTPGVMYNFKVAAYNASGETDSAVQSIAPYTVPDQIAAPSLSNIALTSVDVSWTAPFDGGTAITGYSVYRNSSLIASVAAGTTSYADSGLTAGTTYSYQVVATNVAGSSPISAATSAPTLPAAATAVAATPGNQQITISWTDSVSPVVSGHKVYYRAGTTGAFTLWTSGSTSTSPTTITGLTNGTTYEAYVSVYNASGATESSTVSALSRTVPSQMDAPSLDSISTSAITVSWSAPSSDGGSAVTAYNVYRNGSMIASVAAGTTSYADTSLADGTNYSYQVLATNVAGSSPLSAATAAPTLPAPATDVAAVSGNQEVTVTWTDSTSTVVTGHNLYYRAGTSGAYTLWTSGSTSTSPTTITGLTNGTTYEVYVQAYNASGASEIASASALARTVPSQLNAPSLGSISISTVTVSWSTPSSDGGSAVTGYNVYRNGSMIAVVAAGTTSFEDTGLDAGTTYSYQVEANNIAGASPISSATSAPTLPAAATALGATAGYEEVALAWTNSVSPVVSGYKVFYRAGTTGAFTEWTPAANDTTPTTITGLTGKQLYTFQVRSYNVSGSTDSASVTATPYTIPNAPGTPTLTTAATTSLTVSWTAPDDDGGAAVSSYEIVMNGTLSQSVGAATTSATFTSLTPGANYSFTVRAQNAASWGPYSSSGVYPTLPAAATAVAASSGNSQVTVSWTNSTSAVVTGHKVFYRAGTSGAYTEWTADTTTPVSITGLTNGTTYQVYVSAYNGSGATDSATASALARTTPSQMSAPTLGTFTTSGMTVSWTAPTSDGGSAITGYSVYRGGSLIQTLGADTFSYADTGRTAGTNYSYQVLATNIAGSSPISAATVAPTLPAAATSVAAASGNSQITVSWTNSVSPVVTGHEVYYRAGTSGAYTLWSGTTSPATITGLTNGTTYQVYVSAYNASGATDSATDSALARTVPTQMDAPTLSSAAIDAITVAWTAPSSDGGSAVTGYNVYRNGGLVASVGAGTTSYEHTSLTDGTTYTFQVAATNIAGASTTSASLSATTRPAAATDVAAEATSGSPTTVTVSWTDSPSAVVAGHKLFYRAGTSGSFVEWTSGTDDASGTNVSGLIAGTSYYFRVDAYVVNGGTDYETASTIAGPVTAITTPAAPSSAGTTSGNAAMSLSWASASSTTAAPVSGYKVYVKLASSSTYPGAPSATTTGLTTTISGLTNGSTYDFKVVSYNVAGESLVLATSATPYTTAAAPSIGSATAGYGQVSVTFTAGASGGNSIDSYTAYVYNASTNVLATSLSAAYTGNTQTITVPADNSLTVGTSGTNYYVKVSATNDAGEGSLSSASSNLLVYSTPATPGTPALVSRASGSITMSWTASASTYGSAITGYRMDAFTNSTSTATSVANCTAASTATSCTVSGLDNATTYYFRSRAQNTAGFSAYSSASTGYNPATNPDAPAATGSYAHGANGVVNGAGSLTIGIPAVSDNGSTVTGGTAEVLLTADSSLVGSCTVSGASAGTCSVSGLNPQTSYTVRTKRTNGMGDSTWYTVGSITLIGKPSIGSFSFSHGTPAAQVDGGAQYNTYSVGLTWGTVAYNGTTAGASPFDWACTVNTSPVTADYNTTAPAATTTASYNSNLVTSSGNGSGNTTATSRTCTITASGTAALNAKVGDTAVSTASTTFTSTASTATVALPGYAYPYPYPSFYSGHYPGHYPSHYPVHYSGHYPSHYPVHYSGHYPVHYSGHYPVHYAGHYPVHYAGHYPVHYSGHYPVHYSGHYPRHYPGHYPVHYSGHYPGHYPRHYPGQYYPPNGRRY